jgi:hypothetical protein
MTPDWLGLYWIPLLGWLTAAVLTFVFRKPIAHAVKWLSTVRLTTTKRLAALHALTEAAREQGRTEVQAAVDAQRAVPLPQPNWVVSQPEGHWAMSLDNRQPDVTISDVRMEPILGDFVFDGPNQWPGTFQYSQHFSGKRVGNGRTFGVIFNIEWHDANGDRHTSRAKLEPEPKTAN